MTQQKWSDDPDEKRTMVLVKRMTDGTTTVTSFDDKTIPEAQAELVRLGFDPRNFGSRVSAGDSTVRQAFLSWTKDVEAYKRQVGAK